MKQWGVAIVIVLSAAAVWRPLQAQAPAQTPAALPGPSCAQVPQAQLDANKRVVLGFFSQPAGLTREQRSAATQTPDYIQHNPRFLRMDPITGASGRQAWVKAGDEAAKRGVQLVALNGIRLTNPVMIMAECDLVTAIYKGVLPDPDDQTKTYEAFAFETFRVRDGKVSEHWDQVQLAPGWMAGR